VLGVASHTGPYDGENDEDPPVLRPPSLDIFAFANYSGDPLPDGQPRLLGSLLYPQPCVRSQPFGMSIRTDPGVPWAPSHELCVPFHVARAARVFVIKFYVFNGAAKSVLSFVPLAVLDAHAARMAAAGADPADVPWADWGPVGSRMLLNVLSSDIWVCHVFGTRFATAHPRGRRAVRVTLFDFNTRAYAHGRRFQPAVSPQAEDADWTEPVDMPGGFAAHPRANYGANIEEQGPLIPEAEGSWQYIGADDGEELEGAQEIFAEPVRTRLPYRKLCKDIAITGPGLLHRKVAVQLAEDNLLLVHVRPRRFSRSSSLPSADPYVRLARRIRTAHRDIDILTSSTSRPTSAPVRTFNFPATIRHKDGKRTQLEYGEAWGRLTISGQVRPSGDDFAAVAGERLRVSPAFPPVSQRG
jgi:hypothetical protein